MVRQLPLVEIEGTAFYVDVTQEELWQKDDRSNRISFNVFSQDGDGYTFLYDKIKKNVPDNIEAIQQVTDPYVWVTLPALMELDPEGIALKYDIPLSVLCPDKAGSPFEEDDGEDYL